MFLDTAMSSLTEAKANKYLTGNRVRIKFYDRGYAAINVLGANEYYVEFGPVYGWKCDCPAYQECAHIVACKKIMPELRAPAIKHLTATDTAIDGILKAAEADNIE